MTKPKLTADAAYENAHLVARDLLDRIEELLNDCPAPDTEGLNWGHVGDITEINHRLSTIVRFLDRSES